MNYKINKSKNYFLLVNICKKTESYIIFYIIKLFSILFKIKIIINLLYIDSKKELRIDFCNICIIQRI